MNDIVLQSKRIIFRLLLKKNQCPRSNFRNCMVNPHSKFCILLNTLELTLEDRGRVSTCLILRKVNPTAKANMIFWPCGICRKNCKFYYNFFYKTKTVYR